MQRKEQIETMGSAFKTGKVISAQDREKMLSVIQRVKAPTWLTPVPHNLGAPGTGKVKADQWRVLGAVHLPLALVQIWGNQSNQRNGPILDATFALLSAIIIASSRTTSSRHASEYLQYMRSYMNGIKDIFPDFAMHPNHHMSLHLHEYLVQYGPVHSWWTFPFERLIGTLQHLPINNKYGEYEETIAHAYTSAANFRGVITRAGCPQALRNCQEMVNHLVGGQISGTLSTDMLAMSAMRSTLLGGDVVDDNIHDDKWADNNAEVIASTHKSALMHMLQQCPDKAIYLKGIDLDGLKYSTSAVHEGKANVIIQSSQCLVAAQISYILQIPIAGSIKTFILVKCYLPLQAEVVDPFANYPAFQARLWDINQGELVAVKPSDIRCHFAALKMTYNAVEVMCVVSLSRVSLNSLHKVFLLLMMLHRHIVLPEFLEISCQSFTSIVTSPKSGVSQCKNINVNSNVL